MTADKIKQETGFHIERAVIPDLFASLVNSIVAQQISAKAAETIWERILEKLEKVTPETIHSASVEEIQQCGMSVRKNTQNGAPIFLLTLLKCAICLEFTFFFGHSK